MGFGCTGVGKYILTPSNSEEVSGFSWGGSLYSYSGRGREVAKKQSPCFLKENGIYCGAQTRGEAEQAGGGGGKRRKKKTEGHKKVGKKGSERKKKTEKELGSSKKSNENERRPVRGGAGGLECGGPGKNMRGKRKETHGP